MRQGDWLFSIYLSGLVGMMLSDLFGSAALIMWMVPWGIYVAWRSLERIP